MSEHFGVIDYTVFIVMLIISTFIGFFYAWKDRNNTNEDEFLRGGKHMSVLPVCLSIMASFMSSTGFIGFPVTVYATGTMVWSGLLPAVLAAVLACEVFLPVYYNMNLTSVNEYLFKRFQSHKLQVIGNVSALISLIPFFGVELFAPAIALSIVTDMSIKSSILIIGLIVTLYTSLGGLKGVIWSDVFQFIVIIAGLMVIVIRGASVSGGLAKAFEIAHTGGRIEFWNMDLDIYSINSFWVILFGFTVLWCGTLSTSQLQVQRAVCMPSMRAAKRALYLAMPGFVVVLSLIVLIGIVMYARYADCDPLLTGRVTRADQLLPYFVLDIFKDQFPGMPGMFVAFIFGGSLSTLSSGLNAMASIIWDDYARDLCAGWLPKAYSVYATKVLAILIGLLSIGLAFAVQLTDNIVEAAVMLYGSANGPIFALFCLGLFVPWANAYGGVAAIILGQMFSFWITIGYVVNKRDPRSLMLPLSGEACADRNITVPNANFTQWTTLSEMSTYKIPAYEPTGMAQIYHISPYLVPFIGFIVSFIIGNVVSLATRGNKNTPLDNNLIQPRVCYYMEKLLPNSWRQLHNDLAKLPVPSSPVNNNGTNTISNKSNDIKIDANTNHNNNNTKNNYSKFV
ncbi:sodium-coupled monocarboxylate transporter 1-like [Oppia nitens]|uniref:sodium-coupled monocarboxylate transporter 1-like n=1 Tax=Oppia nitens TaxID=1686743 RepID=UPI0023DA5577|nr:sodium-coupled monocarboxylate transporter 1-like [Oppia nitens]